MSELKDLWIEKSEHKSNHVISSANVLLCADTGRVMAVFYNEYDLDGILLELKNDKAEIVCLKKMIDHGIGWDDLENDFKPFD